MHSVPTTMTQATRLILHVYL